MAGCNYRSGPRSFGSQLLFAFLIQRAIHIDASGRSVMFHPEHFNTTVRILKKHITMLDSSIGPPEAWLHSSTCFDDGRPLILPRWRVQDIDSEEDWRRAELMHRLIEDQN